MMRVGVEAARGGAWRRRQRAPPAPVSGPLAPATRFLHATRPQEATIIAGGIGIAIIATGLRYVLRAGRRMREMEEAERRGEGPQRPSNDGGGGGGADGREGSSQPSEGKPLAGPAFGIDFGTTSLRLSFADGAGKTPQVVENHEGRRSTPAAVSFKSGEAPVVGQLASVARWQSPAATILDIQPFIGLPFSDRRVQKFAASAGFSLVDAGNDVAAFDATPWAGSGAAPMPLSEAASVLLRSMGDLRTLKLSGPPGASVLTRPPNFDEKQAQALESAGNLAGLNVITSVPDAIAAVAAAVEMGLLPLDAASCIVAVVDVGGATAQCTILDGSGGSSGGSGSSLLAGEVVGHGWAADAGGDALETALAKFLDDDFAKKNKGMSLLKDPFALPRLYEAAAAAKIDLSQSASTAVNIPFITADQTGPKHLVCNVTRAQFERAADAALQAALAPVSEALKAAGVQASGVGAVLLVGGGSRVPAIQEAASRLFGRKAVVPVHSEELAVLGAAIAARRAIYGE